MEAAPLAAAGPVGHGEVRGGERERDEEHGLDGDELPLPLQLQPPAVGRRRGHAEDRDGLGEHVAEGADAARRRHPQVGRSAPARRVRA